MKVAIIGGGAAGFFTAINIAEKNVKAQVTIFEKSSKLLSKVKISGGGRCNVTNGRTKPSELINFYPRGEKKLYKPFEQFTTSDMTAWLAQRGVPTHTEEDKRVFPTSNNSQTIIDLFLKKCDALKIKIVKGVDIANLSRSGSSWTLNDQSFDKVVIATGSSEKTWKWLEAMGLEIEPRVPSLFTFNIKDDKIMGLYGLSFPSASVKIAKSKFQETGPLLITHWGLSGPAVLKLSSVAALDLAALSYQFQIIINFLGISPEAFNDWFEDQKQSMAKKSIVNLKIPNCPSRFWSNLLKVLQIPPTKSLSEISKKEKNRIIENMTQSHFQVQGKSTFKDEFVTAGGIALKEIDLRTMASKKLPGLYFAGEVLNIDALTGGFNFQACWTGGWLISEDLKTEK